MTPKEHYAREQAILDKQARIQLILDNLRAALDESQRKASQKRRLDRAKVSAIIAEFEAEFN